MLPERRFKFGHTPPEKLNRVKCNSLGANGLVNEYVVPGHHGLRRAYVRLERYRLLVHHEVDTHGGCDSHGEYGRDSLQEGASVNGQTSRR